MADRDHKDHETNPGTEAFAPDFSDDDDTGDTEDTGTQSWVPDFDDDTGSQPVPTTETPEPAPAAAEQAATETAGAPVQPVTVPGRYLYLKWWQLILALLGVWVVAAVLGLGLFYWWFHSVDKRPAVFAVLIYVGACAVGGVLLAMVEGKSVVAALSLAVMSGPFASVAAAAPLYGYCYCERVGHCLVGVIPY